MKIFLFNRGHIDLQQDPNIPVYRTRSDYFLEVRNFEQAAKEYFQYRLLYCLWPENLYGGYVTNDKEILVAVVDTKGNTYTQGSIFNAAKKRYSVIMNVKHRELLVQCN